MTVGKLLSSYYCQLALQLCQEARILRDEKRFQEAAELCSFVSTLCMGNGDESCTHEAKLCASSAKHLKSKNYLQAEKICMEAKNICPTNYSLRGS